MKKCSFPPSVTPDCSVLVLGSLPGDESLRQAQYYAHPRNAFWKIMGSLLGFDPSLPYGERLSLLNRGGVGLWDVVASGVRPGSLDQHISQEQPNDIAALLDSFPGIGVVCCNGTASHKYLKRYFPELFLRETLSVIQMPSTSPAAARLTYEQKFRAYEEIMAPLEAAEKKKKEEAEKTKKALKDKVKSAGNKLLDRISGRSAEKSGEKQ